MIKPETVDLIFETARIEDVVGDFVKLKKSGVNYTGLCPFHNEKTPSFTVSPAKGICHCFGCGKGGNSVGFIMEHDKKSYPEALKYLADKYHIIIEEEKPDPEREKKQDFNEQLLAFNDFALKYYRDQLKQPENKAALEYVKSRFTDETILLFQIGAAPDSYNGLVAAAKKAHYKENFLLQTGLIRQSEKTNQLYDFFRSRIIFPVFDRHGRCISFSGRVLPGADKKYGKYINGVDTPIYLKRDVLYGLNLALTPIIRSKTAILVEGNPDAIRLHELGISNTVAPLGTALTNGQIKLLKRFAEKIILLYDGDNAGSNALVKSGKLLVENSLIPYAAKLPLGEDPDTFFTSSGQFNEWLEENKKDFIGMFANDLLSTVGEDPAMKNEAINEISNLLVHLDKTSQDLYIENIGRESKLKAKLFSDKLKELNAVKPEDDKPKTFVPEGVDANDFEKWGFYPYKNEYYFRSNKGIEKLSNFIMKPVFHIDSINDSKRIYELINHYGYKVVVDFDMQEMTSVQAFQRNIEGKGNFLFWGTVGHFSKLKLKLYEETRTCQEVKILGWQKEGFWAWANGMITDEGFKEIDPFGVVKHKDTNYFIPAFSKIYINDKSIFLDERKFQYKKRDISLHDWATLFIKVFGDNAKIGIAFWIAAVFRDHLLHIFKNFPLLNLFGLKGAGKSQMAMSMSCLFGVQQTPFNIHNGTKPGLAEHIQQFNNAFAWIDEYKNSLEYDKIETLKSIYDAIGRSRMNIDKGRKKETTQVNSAVILSGQEMPTADVALFSRMLFLQFHQTEFSQEEKDNYDALKTMERDGLSHLTTEIIMHRHYFIEHYFENFQEVLSEFFEKNKEKQIEDRILRNMCTVIAAFKTLEGKLELPFNYKNISKPAFKAIRDQNSQIGKSNEIGMFWNLLEAMFDDNVIIDKWHFRIDFDDKLKVGDHEINFGEGKHILKFKFNLIYAAYAKHSRQQGIKPLPSDTLQYYLKNHKNFIGVNKATRFSLTIWDQEESKSSKKDQVTTAFCFDYDKLDINMEREDAMLNEIKALNGSAHPDNRTESVKTTIADDDELPF